MKKLLILLFVTAILFFPSNTSAKKSRKPTSTPEPTITQKVISPTIVYPVETLIPEEPPLPTDTPGPTISPTPVVKKPEGPPKISFLDVVAGGIITTLLFLLYKRISRI